MAAPIYGQTCHPITPLVKPCSSTALRLYPSAYPSRMGSLILINQFDCGGVIFSLVFRPSRRFIFPAKSLVPTGTAFTVCPAYRFPVIPGRLNFPTRCQPSSSRCSARTCRLPGFYFFDFYSGGALSCSILSISLPLFLLILVVRYVPSLITALWMLVLKNGSSFTLNSIEGELPHEIPSHSC